MKKVVHLFASQRVNRKARTDNEEVFKEKVTLITNKQMSVGQLADFTQLVKDLGAAGIVIGKDKIAIKAKQTSVIGSDGSPIALFDTDGKKLNANLIDAETIVVNGLQANGIQGNTIDAKNATISNLNVNNVILSGSLRNPFSKVSGSFDSNYSDNAVMQVENDGWHVAYSIPWNVEQAGRKICILSNLWGRKQITSASVSISVPEAAKNAGCRFYENGIAKTELNFSTEVLELMAYGNISARTENDTKSHYLYGWIVLNRIDLMTNRSFGRNKKVLAYGRVTGTSSGASIKYRTFDGSTLTVNRIETGQYNIIAPRKWFENEATGYFDLEAVFVNLTGIGASYDKGSQVYPIKATFFGARENIIFNYNDKEHICIDVRTSVNATFSDGSFNFEISNFDDFNT